MENRKLKAVLEKTAKQLEIENTIIGYYKNDKWEYKKHPSFKDNGKNEANRTHDLSFVHSLNLRNELKFYLIKSLENNTLTLNSMFHTKLFKIRPLFEFIKESHPSLSSITQINKETFENNYSNYIEIKYEKPKTREFENTKTPWKKAALRTNEYISSFRVFFDFIKEFYDEREETEKDIWNVKKLGIDYNHSKSSYLLNFESVPDKLKSLAKKYMKSRLLTYKNMTWGTANVYLSKLEYFFNFISEKYPSWKNLNDLKRGDIVLFIQYLRKTKINQNGKALEPTDNHIQRTLTVVETYIGDIQRFEWEEAPVKPITSLILPGDKPKNKELKPDEVKYVPDEVWEQVMNNLHKLTKNMQLLAILLEATGFRVTDVTSLKFDCLLEKEDGYWIIGDQRKVKEKGHRVPISKEIAEVVKKQQEYLKTLDKKITKKGYLIPMESGQRIGEPVLPKYFADRMNSLAHECQIKDKNGNIYWFKNHAFRHRYGVNLINNGMNILHVQKLMAHTSPEMTLTYAQIKDDTLRKEWEKAKNNGAVKLDLNGKVVEADLEKQAEENGIELEWIRHNLDSIRLDHGFCIKSPKQKCGYLDQVLEPPCIKNSCKSFHVDVTFLDYYTEQIDKMESDIELYKKSGRERSIELITPKIDRYKEIRDGIINNGGIYGIPKEKREAKE